MRSKLCYWQGFYKHFLNRSHQGLQRPPMSRCSFAHITARQHANCVWFSLLEVKNRLACELIVIYTVHKKYSKGTVFVFFLFPLSSCFNTYSCKKGIAFVLMKCFEKCFFP